MTSFLRATLELWHNKTANVKYIFKWFRIYIRYTNIILNISYTGQTISDIPYALVKIIWVSLNV